jgi:hypothetical protein
VAVESRGYRSLLDRSGGPGSRQRCRQFRPWIEGTQGADVADEAIAPAASASPSGAPWQHAEGIGRVAGLVVQRPVGEDLPLLVVEGAVLAQELEALLAAHTIEPAARQDGADGGDAVLDAELALSPPLGSAAQPCSASAAGRV